MAFSLPKLPYDVSALEPHLTRENLELHYGKHHQAYVNKLNYFIEKGKADGSKSLEEIIRSSDGAVFNNAAQVWNHTFYWNCMKPNGGGEPTGDLAEAINRSFGSVTKFREQFAAAATGQFGSGWAWVIREGDRLRITSTGNADLPLKHDQTAILTCDVWEHAYYPTYQNARPKYVDAFLQNLINWDFVSRALKGETVAAAARA